MTSKAAMNTKEIDRLKANVDLKRQGNLQAQLLN